MKIHLIDTSGVIFRAFCVMPPLTRRDGLPVGAVHGFCSMLWDLLKRPSERTHIAAVMDAGRSGRDRIYADYKANRKPKPPELTVQFPLIERACGAFGVATLREPGFEADDVIATVARIAIEARGGEAVINSVDKDFYQLMRPGLHIYDPMKKQVMGRDECVAKFGIEPHQVICMQALLGDSVDNVPGVPKIGVKTAAALLQAFGNLDAVLAAARDGRPMPCTAIQRRNLVSHASDALVSRELVKLKTDVPISCPIDDLAAQRIDYGRILDFFEEMEFDQLAERIRVEAV